MTRPVTYRLLADAFVSTGNMVASVPEPATCALMGLGLVGVAAVTRRRHAPA